MPGYRQSPVARKEKENFQIGRNCRDYLDQYYNFMEMKTVTCLSSNAKNA